MTLKIGFIGLGVMGGPMAGHLQTAGYAVTVYNRSTEKARDWVQRYGGEQAATPREAAACADIVMSCVGNDDDLRSVVLGDDGIFAGMQTDAVLVDHTTTSAEVARELDAIAKEQSLHFMDAPISGGQAGAENGVLTVMVGADEAIFQRVEPHIQPYSRFVKRMGDVGCGQISKMVNQICIGGLVQGLAEGLHFARNAGMDGREIIEVISKGAAQSWQMENRYETMWAGEYNHGFAVDWMRKDLDLVLQEAKRNGSLLPVTELVDSYYAEVQAMGGNRWDTSSLLARLEKKKSQS